MLNWANRFNIFCFLDNQQYNFSVPNFECLLAVGCKENISLSAGNAFEELKEFYQKHQGDWLFGHLSYDLKNETEKLSSGNFDGIGFSDTHFFVPEIVIKLNKNECAIFCEGSAQKIYEAINAMPAETAKPGQNDFDIKNRISKASYIETIQKLQQHILRGDCYEINFCQEFFAENAVINPLQVFQNLTKASPNPFAAFYRFENKYCLCASPERYLKKTGNKIISQPIKGTSKRDHEHPITDKANREYLLNNQKEQSENVMVVDLVRNDLSKVCRKGSVKVEELFGLYSFPQVHQMISTVSGIVNENANWVDIIKATFPMGSMTGAPKKNVMQLIEKYEHTKRGLFSGSIGYIDPNGDFDFNVVIRSILYNASSNYLSYQAGSGITFYCDAEQEYEECLLKVGMIKNILKGN